ncbi:MAG: PA2779 family protein [Gammaproteobacteria bacterium]
MRNSLICRFLSMLLVFSTTSVAMVQTASAAVVGTRAVMMDSQRAETLARVQAGLDRADVQAQLEALGVDAETARARIAALTDAELAMLDGRLAELPAGAGIIEVVGIVFVVLLILELVGVTNIFNSF